MEGRKLLSYRTGSSAKRARDVEVFFKFQLIMVDPITAKELIGSFAGLNNFYLLMRKFAHEIQRNGTWRPQRFVHMILLSWNNI